MMQYYQFTLGPVQGFVAQARAPGITGRDHFYYHI
jgi:hypothetical protein